MRMSYLFLAASLVCLILAAVSFAAPEALVLFQDKNAKKVAQCSRLLKNHDDGGKWPDKNAPDYISYGECYYLICGGRRPDA